MLSNISASLYAPTAISFGTASSTDSSHTVSTNVVPATDATSTDSGIVSLGVQLSARLDQLTQSQAIANAEADDALTSLAPGSRSLVSPGDIGSSNREYSLALELIGFDYGSNVDAAGGPFDVIDRVLAALDEMGNNALLAQTRLLPNDAASLA